MNKIGIIAAMQPEMEIIYNSMEDIEEINILGVRFYTGLIGECNVVLSLCGVGKVNAAMAATLLISEFECNLLINTGIAGGVEPLKTRDVIIASDLSYHDFDTTTFGYEYGQVPQMPKRFYSSANAIMLAKSICNKLKIDYKVASIYSGDQFISSMEKLKNLGEIEGVACEMEGAAIAHVAVKAGIDFLVIRFISDIIGAENQIEDYQKFEREMAEMSAKITLQIVNNL